MGNLRDYLIKRATEDPTGIGMSAFFTYEPEVIENDAGQPLKIVARPESLESFDFVGQGAAVSNGLLSVRHKSDRGRRIALSGQAEKYLAAIHHRGPLTLGGILCEFPHNLGTVQRTLRELSQAGLATFLPDARVAITPSGAEHVRR
jgi:hypothetical protein